MVGSVPASALVIEASGFKFSDELGGFRLVSVTGSGGKSDPFVITQDYVGPGPAVLVVHPTMPKTVSSLYIAVICVIRNSGPRPWVGFDFELQEAYANPSDYWDGLSFDQMGANQDAIFASDRFRIGDRIMEPFDRVRFHQGGVDQGTTASFEFFITDPTPRDLFYLLQEPVLLLVEAPLVPADGMSIRYAAVTATMHARMRRRTRRPPIA